MSRRNAEKVIEAGNVKINGVTAHLGDKVDLWLTLDDKKVDSSSAESDKRAQELEEERLEAEAALRDSLEQAETSSRAGGLLRSLFGATEQTEEVTQTDEDEFF